MFDCTMSRIIFRMSEFQNSLCGGYCHVIRPRVRRSHCFCFNKWMEFHFLYFDPRSLSVTSESHILSSNKLILMSGSFIWIPKSVSLMPIIHILISESINWVSKNNMLMSKSFLLISRYLALMYEHLELMFEKPIRMERHVLKTTFEVHELKLNVR